MRLLPLALALAYLLPAPATAGTVNSIDVNLSADVPDADPLDGICDVDATTAGSQCTLRAAIQTANTLLGGTGINLPEGTYALTRKRDPADDPGTGDLDVAAASFIVVNGASRAATVIDGKKGKDRIFDVHLGSAGISLFHLTLRNGKTAKGDFGDTQPDQIGGGCIRSAAFVESSDLTVTGCKSSGDAGCIQIEQGGAALRDTLLSRCKAKDDGGGIEVDNDDGLTTPVDVSRVTITSSKAGDEGGALEDSGAEVNLQNVTLTGNKAKEGGGINAEDGASLDLNNATLADNKAKEGPNLSTADAALGANQVRISNTVFHGKKGVSCAGAGNLSRGGNLEDGTSCQLTDATDQPGVDAGLAPLGDHGGLTPTRPIQEGSPAIDRGVDGWCEAQDQRGFDRIDVAGIGTATCDSGAFEFLPFP